MNQNTFFPSRSARIMGVINVTPDSFSDGGLFQDHESAVAQAIALHEAGADVLDIGAESTRPGAAAVAFDEEWRRLEPVLRQLKQAGLQQYVSVDTRKPEIMRQALNYDVGMINNVGGPCDDETLRLIAGSESAYVAMHMHGTPETMQREPLRGGQAVAVVERFLRDAQAHLGQMGFSTDRIYLDPGIGFGKDDAANLQLLAATARWSKAYPLLIGVSRKGFIGRLLGIEEPTARDGATKFIELAQIMAGAAMIRTHEVSTLVKMRALLSESASS